MAREEYRDGTAAAVLRWRGWDNTRTTRQGDVLTKLPSVYRLASP